MNKIGESLLKSVPSMSADISGVALKEIDYVAFEFQAFDASVVGFYETVMIDRLKKKTYWWGDLRYSSHHPEPFLHNLHFLTHHLRLIHLYQ